MTDKIKDRPEDQRMPVASDSPHMHDVAASLLDARKQLGVRRYGQPLQAFNGRDAAQDVLEEVLDAAAYTAQLVWEQTHPQETFVGRLIDAIQDANGSVYLGGDIFVPEAVTRLLDERGVKYIR